LSKSQYNYHQSILDDIAVVFARRRGKMNKEHKLGLPFEYQHMPEYFDSHNINEQTEVKNALIEKLLKSQHVKTVLDMTCGTGSQVFYLAERSYEVIGSDFSPALIEQAKSKAKKMNRDITFIDGDMRNVKVGKFDAVITIFNAIGHLTKADFEIALQNVRANLKDNGIYIFDIFNLQAITDDIIDSFKMDIQTVVNGVNIRNIQLSEIDRENGFLISHDHYAISKADGEPEIHKNSFSLQIYSAKELQVMLERNGFEVVAQYDMDGNDFLAEKSLNILTVAKKKSG
jgi:ubiquinone/menaquinone biosynthesis C-methylase UbiE